MKINAAVPILSLGILAHSLTSQAAPVRDGHVQAEIISETPAIAAGQSFWVGVHLQMDSAWHVNWLNPGDAGLAPSVKWSLPDGFRAGEIRWPLPESIPQGPLAIFGYEGDVLLLAEVTPPADLPERVSLAARVDWVACGDVCMPGGVDLTFDLPTARGRVAPDPRRAKLFADARAKLPLEPSGVAIKAEVQADAFELTFALPESWSGDVGDIRFFPTANGLIENAAPQKVERRDHSYVLSVPRARNNPKAPDRIAGVAVSSSGWRGAGSERAIAFDVSVGNNPSPLDTLQDRTSNGQ